MNMLGDMTKFIMEHLDRNNIGSWHDVSWKRAFREVQSLRFRIFRCSRTGNLKGLRNLQRLLINCDANLLLSIRKVTQSPTTGVDAENFITPSKRFKLYLELKELGILNWNPFPVKRIYIPKPDGRMRPIGIPTIKDRVVQNVIRNALEPEWEAKFEASSYGFRPGRSVNDAVSRINSILMHPSKRWVFDGDLAQFFDMISHPYLLNKITKYFPGYNLIEKWLKSGILYEFVYFQTEEGTPQGSVISPLLSNIALDGIPAELGIREQADGRVHEYYSRGRTMIRYADDFLVFCKTRADALSLYDELDPILAKRGIPLNKEKSKVFAITDGFDFLGFNHRLAKKFGKSYSHTHSWNSDGEFDFIKRVDMTPSSVPSKKSYKKVKDTLSELFVEYAGKSPTQLVLRANRVIRGWCLSKRAFDCFATFKDLDNFLYNRQLRYIKRRHPTKSMSWRVNKYFAMERNPRRGYFYKWTFKDPSTGIAMLKAFWFWRRQIPGGKIIAYSPVKLDQVPDNPDCREYFHRRNIMLLSRGYADLTKKFDLNLADSQNWCCPVCNVSFGYNLGEPIHRHHIVERRLGGKDTPSNLILVHWPCHMKVHYDVDKKKWTNYLFAFKKSRGLISLPLNSLPLELESGDIEPEV